MIRNIALATILIIVPLSTASAQWKVDGVKFSNQSAGDGVERRWVASDGEGGIIMTWRKIVGPNNSDVFVQRLDAAGVPLWTPGGVLLCNAPGHQFESTVVTDDAGGAIVIWQDNRSGTGASDVYAQRVDWGGDPLWTANGVALCTAPSWQADLNAVPDGFGGAIVAWLDARNSSTYPDTNIVDIYAQRVDPAGVVQWGLNGVGVCVASHYKADPAIEIDGFGGAFMAWADERSGGQIYAQYLPSGNPLWTANGLPVSTGSSYKASPHVTFDGVDGFFVAWTDRRNGIEYDVYARMMDPLGPPKWGSDVALCVAAGDQILTDLDYDPVEQSAHAVWIDQRSGFGQEDVYAQSVDVNGAIQWGVGGAAICNAAGSQVCYQVTHNYALAGALFAWHDGRGGETDIYAQKLNAAGAAQWTANGVAMCTATGNQSVANLVADGTGGVIAAWGDLRSGTLERYAQRVLSNGHATSFAVTSTAVDFVTGTLMEAIVQANAIPGAQTIRFDIPGPGPHVIDAFLSTIPAITDGLTIDGFTQPGSAPNTNPIGSPSNAQIQVEIMGWTVVGLDFQATGTVRGVAINGFGSCISAGAPYVVVEGNYIGTDHTGTQYPPFLQHLGVLILGDHCRVGGSTPASRNVIGYGTEAGIRIYGAPNAEVYGNYIGVGADAATNFGSSIGVDIMNNATAARIGSSTIGTSLNPAEANLIVNNFKNVVVRGAGSIGNFIAGNSMLGTYLMIDLNNDSYTLNDALDTDAGPNGLQNYPVLSSAAGSQINGTMDGAANVPLYLHFYWSANCCLNAGHYIGGALATLDGNGSAPFTFSPAGPIPPAAAINATATDMAGNTSEVAYAVTYQNTGSGSAQVATLMSASGTVYGSATFATVTAAGNTYTTNPYMPPVPVSGYAIGNPNDPQIYYDVTTDVSYSGGVDVCLIYDENSIPGPEANLVLLHYDGSMWVNVTTSRDLVSNKICGHVTTLSPFVIGAVATTGVGGTPVPTSFALHTNVPNPFNPITTIGYDVPAGGADVGIVVYDVAGRQVRSLVNEHRAPGTWSVQWNGEDDRGVRVASGVYFYRMRAGSFVETRKMILLK